MAIEMSEGARKQAVASIKRYVADEMDQEFAYWPGSVRRAR